jgi:NADPH:quinone reductase-like Zn-dependent oxidoreductase
MKAVRIHQFGGTEVLKYEDAPRPQISSDEVLIKVYASSVNPVDWKIREGKSQERFPTNFPLTLGWDVSGVVEEIGQDVKNFKKGDEVYGRPFPTKNGAYAEYIAVKENEISIKPVSITHDQAAAVPLACLTAWQGLFDHGLLQKDQKVLIHAASGGVGAFAVQLAKWKGAYVIGTASEKNISFVEQLGADEVIDYKTEKFEDKLEDIDLVFDTIGGDTQKKSLRIIKNGGRLITTVKPDNIDEAKAKNIHLEGYMTKSYPEQLKQIAALIDEGKLKIFIAEIFPLDRAAEAQELSEKGHTRGKIVLEVVHQV